VIQANRLANTTKELGHLIRGQTVNERPKILESARLISHNLNVLLGEFPEIP
jgi:hypothetical protein